MKWHNGMKGKVIEDTPLCSQLREGDIVEVIGTSGDRKDDILMVKDKRGRKWAVRPYDLVVVEEE